MGAAALTSTGIVDDTVSRRDDGPAPDVVRCVDELDEARVVAERVGRLLRRHGPRQVAVLARTNDQLGVLERSLTAAGVSTTRSAGTSALDRCLSEALACRGRDELAAWVDRVWSDEETDPIRTRVAEEVDRFLAVGDTGTLRAWFDTRHAFEDLEPDGAGSVTLSTFHAAKGREWSAVVVAGVEAGLVPHSSSASPAQRAEEARLLHVALTRAGEDLTVTCAEARGGSPTGPSPWLADLQATIVHEPHVGPTRVLRRESAPDPLEPLRAWRAAIARRAEVPDTAVCPDRVLRSLLADPPVDVAAVADRLGIGRSAAERLAPGLLEILSPAGPRAHA